MHLQAAPTLSEVLGSAAEGAPTCNVFALVDGALLRDLPERAQRVWPVSKARSLLTGGTGAGAAEVGPLLFPVSQKDIRVGLPATLLDNESGRCAGSFLISNLALNDIADQLTLFVDVKLADASTMVMRFFDPRVLPFWLKLVRQTHSSQLAAALESWIFWDAQENLSVERFEKHLTPSKENNFPLHIGELQEQHLINSCYPFTLIERFRLQDPSELIRIPVVERYEFFKDQVNRARAYGIETSGDIEVYCGLAIELGTRFDQDEVLGSLLLRVKEGTKFADLLAVVSDLDWSRIKGLI